MHCLTLRLTHTTVSHDCLARLSHLHKLSDSSLLQQGACGIDFFVQDLEGENCLVVPPVVVLPRVFQSMCVQKAVGTVVAPVWPSASFWPLLHRKYGHYVKDHVLELGSVALRHDRNENSLLGSRSFTGQVMALRCDFRVT